MRHDRAGDGRRRRRRRHRPRSCQPSESCTLPELSAKHLADRRGGVLFVGCGKFGFEVAFAQQHPSLRHLIVASDHLETWGCAHDSETAKNIHTLQSLGVCVGALDAGDLPPGHFHFARVQFNCPCGIDKTPVPAAVGRLFKWCRDGGLSHSGKLHISCHGNQEIAQKNINLVQHVRDNDFQLTDFRDDLPEWYTPTRTNGRRFRGDFVRDYVFQRRGVAAPRAVVNDRGGYFDVKRSQIDHRLQVLVLELLRLKLSPDLLLRLKLSPDLLLRLKLSPDAHDDAIDAW